MLNARQCCSVPAGGLTCALGGLLRGSNPACCKPDRNLLRHRPTSAKVHVHMELRRARSPNIDRHMQVNQGGPLPPGAEQPRLPGINRSVDRALTILLEAARSPRPMSFGDFQKRLKVPKATLHKLLWTLEKSKFLRRDDETGKYSIGLAAMELTAGGTARPGDVRSVLDPILHKLVEAWNETCHFCVMDAGDEIVRR